MATGNSNSKKATLKYVGHVNAPALDAARFSEASEKYDDAAKILDGLSQLVSDGYTVKLTPSNSGERIYVEIGGTNIAPQDAKGRYLSSFGGTLESGCVVGLFRHFVMFEERWPTDEELEWG